VAIFDEYSLFIHLMQLYLDGYVVLIIDLIEHGTAKGTNSLITYTNKM